MMDNVVKCDQDKLPLLMIIDQTTDQPIDNYTNPRAQVIRYHQLRICYHGNIHQNT